MPSGNLSGSRILVVEDEYFLADDARCALAGVGAEVVGPVPSIAEASAVIEADRRIDGVLLDVNLRGELAFDLADTLRARIIPFAFVTGYDRAALPCRFAATPAIAKPIDAARLVAMVQQLMAVPRGR